VGDRGTTKYRAARAWRRRVIDRPRSGLLRARSALSPVATYNHFARLSTRYKEPTATTVMPINTQ
jgi:hypothetical protein